MNRPARLIPPLVIERTFTSDSAAIERAVSVLARLVTCPKPDQDRPGRRGEKGAA